MKKTKRRYLRKELSWALVIIEMFAFILWASIDDFEPSFTLYYLLGWVFIYANGYLIYKWVNPKYFVEKVK